MSPRTHGRILALLLLAPLAASRPQMTSTVRTQFANPHISSRYQPPPPMRQISPITSLGDRVYLRARSQSEVHQGGGAQRAVFGGGCFWCIEAVFRELKGVKKVVSGYAGGTSSNPTYEAVCSGKSGHAEVVAVEFNPKEIAYKDLLDVFWAAHDPTTKNRQGLDIGSQYRSVIFYTSEDQRTSALESINKQSKYQSSRRLFGFIPTGRKIVTELEPLKQFHSAESYHQNYYKKMPYVPYCSVNIAPKIIKIKTKFQHLLRGREDDALDY
ncbi:hypothetical protein AAMO2058_000771400 [Amorphochlora amoebiformis]